MIPEFVVLHFAHKVNISYEASLERHIDLENFFSEVVKHGTVTPSISVDETWHNFILHTRLYADYCHNNYGQFIHHNPHLPTYIGITTCNGEEEEKECDAALKPTATLAPCDGGNDGDDGGSRCDSQFKPILFR